MQEYTCAIHKHAETIYMTQIINTVSSTPSSNVVEMMIGEAADYAGVHPKTLRRWEAEGILMPQRNELNQRVYTAPMLTAAIELKKQRKLTEKSTRFYRISEVSNTLQVSQKTIRRWHAAGAITCTRNELNQRLFSETDLKKARQYKQQLDDSKYATMPPELAYGAATTQSQNSLYPPTLSRIVLATIGVSSIPLSVAAYSHWHTSQLSTSGIENSSIAISTSMVSPLATNQLGIYIPEVLGSSTTSSDEYPTTQLAGMTQLPVADELPLQQQLLTTGGPLDTTPPAGDSTVDEDQIRSWPVAPTPVQTTSPGKAVQLTRYSLLATSEHELLPDIGLVNERIQTMFLVAEGLQYERGMIVCYTSDETVAPCNDSKLTTIAGVLLEVKPDALLPKQVTAKVLTMGLYSFDAMGLMQSDTIVTVDETGSIQPLSEAGYALGKVVRVVHGDTMNEVTVAVDPGWHDPSMVITEDGSLSRI